jgi:hypothetical protein
VCQIAARSLGHRVRFTRPKAVRWSTQPGAIRKRRERERANNGELVVPLLLSCDLLDDMVEAELVPGWDRESPRMAATALIEGLPALVETWQEVRLSRVTI